MTSKYICWTLMMVIVVVSMLGVVNGEMLVSDVGVEYDDEILGAFENQTKIPIVVRLKDTSDIEIIGTREEKRELMRQRDELFKPKINEVLSTFQEDEFELIGKHSNGFDAWVTLENINKLINNSNVKSILWIKTGTQVGQEDIKNEANDGTKDEINNLEKKESKFNWFWIVPLLIIFIIVVYILIKRKS